MAASQDESSSQPKRVNFDDDGVLFDEPERLLVHGELHTGEAVETTRLEEGPIIIQLNNYKNGVEDGVQREFYIDGMLRSEYTAVNGVVNGLSREWHLNGKLARRKEFDNYGKPRKIETWDEDGNLLPGTIDSW